jgi:hypothetical protein
MVVGRLPTPMLRRVFLEIKRAVFNGVRYGA